MPTPASPLQLSWLLNVTSPNIRSGSTDMGRQPNLSFGAGFNVTPDPVNQQNIVSVNVSSSLDSATGDVMFVNDEGTVLAIQSTPVASSSPSLGQALVFNDSEYVPTSLSITGNGGTSASGTGFSFTVSSSVGADRFGAFAVGKADSGLPNALVITGSGGTSVSIVGSTLVVSSSLTSLRPACAFTMLSTLAPLTATDVINVYGYSTPGDGGEGTFSWAPASTATPDGGTVVSVPGISTGRWFRNLDDVISVKFFGATGNGSTDDTQAILKAVKAFVTASLQSAPTTQTFYAPGGTYSVSSMTTLTGLRGARFKGDGRHQTRFVGTSAMTGQPAVLRFTACRDNTLEGFGVAGPVATTTLTSAVSKGATSVTVLTASINGVPLQAGQLIGLCNINGQGGTYPGTNAEEAIIANTYTPGSTTVPLSWPTQYAYLSASLLNAGVGGLIDFHSDVSTGFGATSNSLYDIDTGADYNLSCVAGVSFTCEPGSDDNNDEHRFFGVTFTNTGNSGVYLGHLNSLAHRLVSCDWSGGVNGISAPLGGSAIHQGCIFAINGTWMRVCGTQNHAWIATDVTCENQARMLDMAIPLNSGSAQVKFHNVDNSGGGAGYHLTGNSFVLQNGVADVTATSSLFTKELVIGMGITFINAQPGVPYIVKTIVSDTHVVLTAPYNGTSQTTTVAGQALIPLISAAGVNFTIDIAESNICPGADPCVGYMLLSDSSGRNISSLNLSNSQFGMFGFGVNNVNVNRTNTRWDGLPSPTVAVTGSSVQTWFNDADNDNAALTANFGTLNKQGLANVFQDLIGSNGGAVAWYGGNAEALTSANYKLRADDTTLTLNAPTSVTLDVNGGSGNSLTLNNSFGIVSFASTINFGGPTITYEIGSVPVYAISHENILLGDGASAFTLKHHAGSNSPSPSLTLAGSDGAAGGSAIGGNIILQPGLGSNGDSSGQIELLGLPGGSGSLGSGNGSGILLSTGNGGATTGANNNGNGGGLSINLGTAGTGGSGTAGVDGQIVVTKNAQGLIRQEAWANLTTTDTFEHVIMTLPMPSSPSLSEFEVLVQGRDNTTIASSRIERVWGSYSNATGTATLLSSGTYWGSAGACTLATSGQNVQVRVIGTTDTIAWTASVVQNNTTT